jgi:hypothetical protein
MGVLRMGVLNTLSRCYLTNKSSNTDIIYHLGVYYIILGVFHRGRVLRDCTWTRWRLALVWGLDYARTHAHTHKHTHTHIIARPPAPSIPPLGPPVHATRHAHLGTVGGGLAEVEGRAYRGASTKGVECFSGSMCNQKLNPKT